MGRKYDADLCRAKGWGPGALLRMETTGGDVRWYVLTGIGRRAILAALVHPGYRGTFTVDTHEYRMAGRLYQYAITCVGKWCFDTETFELFEGTEELANYREWVSRNLQKSD